MKELFFGWLYKPKLLVSTLDHVFMYAELVAVIIPLGLFSIWLKERKRKATRKKHGKNCTCWTCMGVN